MRGSAVTTLACEPPLAAKVRREAQGGLTLWMVNSGATLLEGDALHISLRLSGGARLAVHSVASQLVHPCLDGGWSSLTIDAELDDDSVLHWQPEPIIVAAGANYRSRVTVRSSERAALRWVDEVVLGRSGEDTAALALDTAMRIDVDGRPRWRDGLSTAPGWTGPAVLGAARYIATEVELGEHFATRFGPTDRPPTGVDRPFEDSGPIQTGGPLADGGPLGGGVSNGAGRLGAVAGRRRDPWSSGWLALAGGGRTRRTLAHDPLAGRPLLHGYP